MSLLGHTCSTYCMCKHHGCLHRFMIMLELGMLDIRKRHPRFLCLVQLDTAVDDRPNYVAMLGVGVLKSHARMGVLRISCISGCTCTPAEFDTHWHQKISLRQLLYFNTTCHPNCILRFTNIKPNHTAVHERGHRLKLDTLVVRRAPLLAVSAVEKVAVSLPGLQGVV